MKLVKVVKKDAPEDKEVKALLAEIEAARKSMDPGMSRISNALKKLKTLDENLFREKIKNFRELTYYFYEI